MAPKKPKILPWRAKCCVEGCSVRICSGVPMHGFPNQERYPDLYEHWLDAIRLANSTPHWKPRKSHKVCAFHFETVQDVRIRVPTLFPHNERKASTSNEPDDYDEDEDEDEDPTEGTAKDLYEDDPMDTYEDSMAVDSIDEEQISGLPEDSKIMAEDPTTTYEEIEQEYNNIVGDVVSTLVTYDDVVVENSCVPFNDMVEQNTVTLYSGFADEEAAPCDNVETEPPQSSDVVGEEIVYDDPCDDDESSMQAKSVASQDDIDQHDEYCLVVVRHETSDPENTNELTPSNSQSQPQITVVTNSIEKPPSKKSTKKTPPLKSKKSPKKSSSKTPKLKPGSSETANLTAESVLEQQETPSLLTDSNGKELVGYAEPEKSSPVKNSPLTKQESLGEPAEENQEVSCCKCQAKPVLQSDVADVKTKDIQGVKIGDVSLDGETIKLKECSVSLIKSPVRPYSKSKPMPKSKKKALMSSKASNSIEKSNSPKKSTEQRPIKNNEATAKGPSDILGALSLKSTQEDETSGLRRSARIRAVAGKKRRFGRRSWSVAFKEAPKKKMKVEIDDSSVSSESVPYDFEADNDPDVAPEDLKESESDSSESDSWVSEVNGIADSETSCSSRGKGLKTRASNLNGVTKLKRTTPYRSRSANKGMHHGHSRVKRGDLSIQVGLPGSCDGFVFDVVRDDPRNVGVSCNIFYHYLPKYSRYSAPNRRKRVAQGVDVPSTETTKTGLKPNIPLSNIRKAKFPVDKPECGARQTDDFEWRTIIEPPQYPENLSEMYNAGKSGDSLMVGEIKVESSMEFPPSLDNEWSDAANVVDIKEEDPYDLSGVIRIDDHHAPSSKTGNGSTTLPSKGSDAQSDSVGSTKPAHLPNVEDVEQSINVESNPSTTTPEPETTVDGKLSSEYSDVGDSSSHGKDAQEIADVNVPGNEPEPIDTSDACLQPEHSERSEYSGSLNINSASDPSNEHSVGAEHESVGGMSNSSDLIEDAAEPQLEVGVAPAKEQSEPLDESMEVLEETSPTSKSLIEDERTLDAKIIYSCDPQKSTFDGSEHSIDPAIISSDTHMDTEDMLTDHAVQNDVIPPAEISVSREGAENTLNALMDSGRMLTEAENDVIPTTQIPESMESGAGDTTTDSGEILTIKGCVEDNNVIPPAQISEGTEGAVVGALMDLSGIREDSGHVEDSGEILPAEIPNSRHVGSKHDAPMDLGDIQEDSGGVEDNNREISSEVQDGEKSVNSAMEIIDLDGIIDDPAAEHNDSTDSEPEILEECGAAIKCSNMPDSRSISGGGIPARSASEAPSAEEHVSILDSDVEPVLISSDSSDDEASASNVSPIHGILRPSDVRHDLIPSENDIATDSVHSQSRKSCVSPRTETVHQEKDSDSENLSISQHSNPLQGEANSNGGDDSQEVFDCIENNLKKMFDMDP